MSRIEGCKSVGIVEKNGAVVAMDLMVSLDGISYVLEVVTPEFLALTDVELEGKNEKRFWTINSISNAKAVCREIRNVPPEDLKPYLTQQEE